MSEKEVKEIEKLFKHHEDRIEELIEEKCKSCNGLNGVIMFGGIYAHCLECNKEFKKPILKPDDQ